MSKTYLAHKFRLKPTKEQAVVLKSWSDINRYVWNHFLAANQNKYQEEKKFIFYHEMATSIPALKKEQASHFKGYASDLRPRLNAYGKREMASLISNQRSGVIYLQFKSLNQATRLSGQEHISNYRRLDELNGRSIVPWAVSSFLLQRNTKVVIGGL